MTKHLQPLTVLVVIAIAVVWWWNRNKGVTYKTTGTGQVPVGSVGSDPSLGFDSNANLQPDAASSDAAYLAQTQIAA